MKHFFIITWMASVLCCGAENTTTTEHVRPIMEASRKPFSDFVSAASAVEIPPLPLPKSGEAATPIDAVSALVWERLSAVDVVVKSANKTEKLEAMQAMGKLRGWLLKHDAYANLVFVAYIEDTVTMSTLSALAQGTIAPDEARSVLALLAPDITVNSMLSVIQQTVPQSKALEQIRSADAAKVTLLTVSSALDGELHEQGVRVPANLAEQERPASLAFCVALSTSSKRLASLLIEYAAKGGNLNLPSEALAKEITRLTPKAIGTIDPASGLKIEAMMFGGVMENAAEWKSRS